MPTIPKMTVEKSKKLKQGNYTGRVLSWTYEERTRKADPQGEAFSYADLNVGIKDPTDNQVVTLKVGFPVGKLTPDSALGKLMSRFGHPIAVGEEVDATPILDAMVDTDVSCRVSADEKGFSRIEQDSLSPAVAAATANEKVKGKK